VEAGGDIAMQKPTLTLSKKQIALFHQEGYLVVPVVITLEEVERLREIFNHLFASKAGREDGNQYDLAGTDKDDQEAVLPQIVNPSKYAPELETADIRDNTYAIARQLLGPEATSQSDHAIMKPPEVGAVTPWHQDEAYWAPDLEYNSISIWVPLQEVTLENGCMHFIPGSHKLEVAAHRPIGQDSRIHGLEAEHVDASQAVACPIAAGGATIHHCRTIHYAGPNHTNHPRLAYINVFATPPKQRVISRDFDWKDSRQTLRDERRRAAGTKPTSDGRQIGS
jgi:ectoine hydroxylase-related dioxygenase (phytanoyl-CoA dioxygenase family)